MKSRILFTEKEIRDRVSVLADEIISDYESEDVIFVSVLSGAFIFTSDLIRVIDSKGYKKYIVDFVRISSYGKNKKSSRTPVMSKDLEVSVENKNVIVIEDIVETGNTLKFLVDKLKEKRAKNIKICTLLSKPLREVDIEPDYLGFSVEKENWVEGYGLDTAGFGRGKVDIVVNYS